MRVAVHTLGCRLNQFESDAIEHRLRGEGHEVTDALDDADAYVINSCTITHEADAETRKLVRRAVRRNPGMRVIVTGCYANAAPEEVAALPGVDVVLGNAEKPAISGYLGDAVPHVSVEALTRKLPFLPLAPAPRPRRSRVLLKVQDGCAYRCSFCIVPQVRGGSRSLPVPDVVRQLDEIVAAGAPEVVLTGIHLGTYGRDLSPRRSIADLVAAIVPRLRQARLRLSSIDPHEVDDELIALMREHRERICRHLHLPVQSGDPDVLRRMRRGHTVEDFVRLTGRLAAEVPGIGIGSDVIVGFPGESQAAFENTLELMRTTAVAYAHVFPYSPRSGTPAAAMEGHLPREVIRGRGRELRRLMAAKRRAFGRTFAGSDLPAVVLADRDRSSGMLVGVTDNYLRLRFDGDDGLRGKWVRLRPDGAGGRAALVP